MPVTAAVPGPWAAISSKKCPACRNVPVAEDAVVPRQKDPAALSHGRGCVADVLQNPGHKGVDGPAEVVLG